MVKIRNRFSRLPGLAFDVEKLRVGCGFIVLYCSKGLVAVQRALLTKWVGVVGVWGMKPLLRQRHRGDEHQLGSNPTYIR
jgi:hypothetical protein